LAAFVLPAELCGQIKKVVIFADADEAKTMRDGHLVRAGSHAAATLADSLRKQGVQSLIVRPAKVGDDFADFWIQTLKKEAAKT
jgi:hypothetical protein